MKGLIRYMLSSLDRPVLMAYWTEDSRDVVDFEF